MVLKILGKHSSCGKDNKRPEGTNSPDGQILPLGQIQGIMHQPQNTWGDWQDLKRSLCQLPLQSLESCIKAKVIYRILFVVGCMVVLDTGEDILNVAK